MVPELYGFLIGVLTGLIPGIHPNTFASLMLGSSAILAEYFSMHEIAVMIFVSSIVYSVVNIIPAVLIGVPDEDTSIAVLPAHRMVIDGEGFKAISISAISSFLSCLLSIPIFYAIIFLRKQIAELMDLTTLVLFLVSLYLLSLEREEFGGSLAIWKKRFYAFLIFLSSGVLGYFSVRFNTESGISMLFPLLSGLFGFPTLIVGMTSEKVSEQAVVYDFPSFKSLVRGVLSGFFVSLFPGISSGVATAVSISKNDDEKAYITAVSSANTSNALLNFAVFASTGRIRSGAVQAYMHFASGRISGYLPLIALSASFSAMMAVFFLSIPAVKILNRINPSRISIFVLVFLLISVLITTGFTGLAIFSLASLIGLSTLYLRVRRIHCMGSIILPALLY